MRKSSAHFKPETKQPTPKKKNVVTATLCIVLALVLVMAVAVTGCNSTNTPESKASSQAPTPEPTPKPESMSTDILSDRDAFIELYTDGITTLPLTVDDSYQFTAESEVSKSGEVVITQSLNGTQDTNVIGFDVGEISIMGEITGNASAVGDSWKSVMAEVRQLKFALSAAVIVYSLTPSEGSYQEIVDSVQEVLASLPEQEEPIVKVVDDFQYKLTQVSGIAIFTVTQA